MLHSKSHANEFFRPVMFRQALPRAEDGLVQPCPPHSTGNHPDKDWIKITHDGLRWRIASLCEFKAIV